MKFILVRVLLLIQLCFSASLLQAQSPTFTKSSIKFATGVGVSGFSRGFGPGYYFSAGYQRTIGETRFRINPNLTYGVYNTRMTTDVGDIYYNSLNFQFNAFAEFLRSESSALVLGLGAVLNNTRGMDANNGYRPQPYGPIEYFTEYNFGGIGYLGLRFSKPDKRVGVEIFPITLQIATRGQMEMNIMRIGIDVKL